MVVVIGAGPAGLATAYHLQRQGVPYRVLEKGAIGSSWQNHYHCLRLNSLKELSFLPGLKMPRHYPAYPAAHQFASYLEQYVRHFNLNVECNVEVTSITPSCNKWCLHTRQGRINTGILVLATGTYNTPFLPKIEGQDLFAGRILHSRDYQDPEPFVGQRVLVIGAGSSSVDIALDLAKKNVDVSLSVRNGINLVPRVYSSIGARLMLFLLNNQFTRPIFEPIISRLQRDFRHIGLPRHPASKKNVRFRPVVGYEIVDAIRSGKVRPYADVKHLTRNGAQFSDGCVGVFNSIIFATGYRPTLGLVNDHVYLDAEGYPKLNGYQSLRNSRLYCVGFSPEISERQGWLRSIGRIARDAVSQIIKDYPDMPFQHTKSYTPTSLSDSLLRQNNEL